MEAAAENDDLSKQGEQLFKTLESRCFAFGGLSRY